MQRRNQKLYIFHNMSKVRVDRLNQKCDPYSVGHDIRRWPMCIRYALMNVAGVYAYFVHNATNPTV